MDALEFLDHLLKFLSTKEGEAMVQVIQQVILTEAGKRLLSSEFTPEECKAFEKTVKLCLGQAANDITKNVWEKHVIMCLCIRLDSAFTQGCDIFKVFHFFYRILGLLESAFRLDGSNPGEEIMVNAACHTRANHLWKTLFIDTNEWQRNETTTVTLLKDLTDLAFKNFKNNPAFAYYVIQDLRLGYQQMRKSFTPQAYNDINADLVFLLAKCTYQAEQYKLAIFFCKQASELYACSKYIVYEVWAKALEKTGNLHAAISQLEFAKSCVQNEKIQHHLQEYMDKIRKELSTVSHLSVQSSLPDDNWLGDTNIRTTQLQQAQAQQAKDAHVKKKRHSRPKREPVAQVQVSPNDWLMGTPAKSKALADEVTRGILRSNLTPYQTGLALSEPIHLTADNNPLLKYAEWETSSEDDESDLEDPIKMLVPQHEEREQEVTKVKCEASDKTWFEESKEMYENGQEDTQIVSGMLMEVQIQSIEAKQYQQTRAPFYREMEAESELKRLMSNMSDDYKHCKIELESPHKAVCKLVSSDEKYSEIEIHGRSKCGQTFNQDEVCVEILSHKQSHQAPTYMLTKRTEEDNKVYGRVVGVLKTNFRKDKHPVMACTCDDEEGFLLHPLCKSVPKIHALNGVTKKMYPSLSKYRIDTYKIDENGKLRFKRYFDVKPGLRKKYVFLVVYLTWGHHHVYPLGAVIDILECGTDFSGGMKVLEMQYQVPRFFAKKTVDHINKMLEQKTVLTGRRVDCTRLTVFTIDPSQSNDLDDALSVSKKDNHFLVGVHIADVASVVKKGDPVDQEAQKRATSYYPGDSRVHHMLPEPLSENYFSLLPNVERLALSIFFHIEKSGKLVKEPSVMRTVIRSCQKLSYEETQKVIDHEVIDGVSQDVIDSITVLHEIAQNLRKERIKDSRFAVPFEDTRFLDSENIEETVEAHALVEEFMIKANNSIAHWLKKKFPDCIPIRCQSEPLKEDLQKFAQTERFLDIVVDLQGREILPSRKVAAENWVAKRNTVRKEPLPIQRNIWLQILEGVHDDKMKEAMKIMCKDEVHPFQAVALQHWRGIMETAEYKCSVEPEKELRHFSLNTKMYTHFTSPIRRYVDLIVHRLVHAALDGKLCPYTAEDISHMCVYINDATARQKHFSNGCKALKRAEKMSQRPMVFHAFVKNVTDSGAELCIPSLKHISGKSRELPFNLMDFSKKPEESHDALSDKTIVWGKWKKRLYDCTGCPNQLIHSQALERQKQRPKHVVDPHQYVYFVDTQTWAKMLKADFSEEHKTVKKILNTQSPEGQNPPRGPPARDTITSEYGDGTVKFHHCRFELCFAPGRVIKVQMVANPVGGILTPQVRLFHVFKNLTLCLSHMEDPVGVLSKYATESTKKNIESVAEYQRAWLPLLEMEAATSAVCSEENVIINNVSLEFKRKAGKSRTFYSGKFTLPSKFINDRCIEFGGKSLEKLKEAVNDDDDDERSELSSVDYLCIRCQIQQSKTETVNTFKEPSSKKVVEVQCPLMIGRKKGGRSVDCGTSYERSKTRRKVIEVQCPMKARSMEGKRAPGTSYTNEDPYTWVGHGQVVKVRRQNYNDMDSVTMTFNINANSDAVPDHLMPTAIGTVEVIFKSEVDRRTIRMIQNLTSDEHDLASCIALHRKAPKLDKDRIDYGKKMEKEVSIRELPKNNMKQHAAIDRALTSSFSLIQGPPGTGKTYTGIKLVYLFEKINKFLHLEGVDNQKKQVLFCGPSNKAVDLVARLLLHRLGEMCPKIIRLYGSNIVSQDYPVPKRNFMSKRSIRDLKSDPNLYNVSLHHMIRQSGKPHADEIKMFDALFRKNPDAVTPNHLKKYSKLVYTAYCEELKKCDVVLCTCAVGGNQKLIQSTRIYQCIIDECAMSPEPQTMVPIIATKAKQVVLIGDHKQLRPVVLCKEAAELGLDQSLFERFAAQATFLNIQYRMNPRLCDFPSDMFYGGKLETGPSKTWEKLYPWEPLKLWPVKEVPHVLCHVEGVEEILSVSTEEGNEQSRSNKAETDKVCDVFKWLVEKENVNPHFINVISQYNAQCSKIRDVLRRYHPHHRNINVNTVVASQGGEWDYIIFSTVRSLPDYKIEKHPTLGWSKHNLGFITDANQINVALTRARKGLIIIGNQNLLRSDIIFKSLIEKYEKQGCLVDGRDFPRKFQRAQPRRRAQIPGVNWQNVSLESIQPKLPKVLEG